MFKTFLLEEYLQNSINDLWNDVMIPHLRSGEIHSVDGTFYHPLDNLIQKFPEFNAMVVQYYEPRFTSMEDAEWNDEISDDDLHESDYEEFD